MPHFVHPKIGYWGMRLEFTCTEQPGADCKITCPPDAGDPYRCESFVVERDDDGTPWHVGFESIVDGGRLHQMVPREECLILEWDDLEECYRGEDEPLREGEVVFEWVGDNYIWKYKP